MPDFNVVLNLLMLAIVVVAAVPVLQSKRKDAVIAEQKLVVESHEKRISALESDLVGAQTRANEAAALVAECERQAVEWKARYDEMAKYTAGPAVQRFETMLLEHQLAVAKRHALMIKSLEGVTEALAELQLPRPNAA